MIETKRDLGQELLDGIREIKAGGGKKYTVKKYDNSFQIRKDLNMSRQSFAAFMGISERTIEGWEQGTRKPTGAALSLLRIAAKHPEAFTDIRD